MDLQDQLKNLFPDHVPQTENENTIDESDTLWVQDDPLICKFEKNAPIFFNCLLSIITYEFFGVVMQT